MSIRRLDTGHWQVRRWDERGRERTRTFNGKREADAYDLDLKRAKMRGELDLFDGGHETLAEYADAWWKPHVAGREPKTQAVYQSIYRTHIEPKLGSVPLRGLRANRVRRFQEDLEREGVGPAAIEKSMRVLSAILGLAEDDERIARNPVSKVTIKTAVAKSIRPLIPVTVELLRAHLEPRGAMLVSLMAYAGLRPQEVHAPYGPRWCDVGERTLLTRSHKTERQGKPYRSVKLLGPLKQDLAEWRMACGRPGDDAWVLPGQRGQEGWSQASYHRWRAKRWPKATEAVGIRATPYTLRHSFANLLLMAGHPPAWVAEQMGHTLQTLDKDYRHIIAELGERKLEPEAEIRKARSDARVLLAREQHARETG